MMHGMMVVCGGQGREACGCDGDRRWWLVVVVGGGYK